MKVLRVGLASMLFVTLALIQGGAASAAPTYSLFGDATLLDPGHASDTAAQLRSAGTGYGGVRFDTAAGMTVSQLHELSTDYMFTAGGCAGGAPRFQINVSGANIFVYIGPPPSYTGCSMNAWVDTGNLVTAASLVDTSQLAGGTFYDTWGAAQIRYGTNAITGIQLVTDGAWAVGGTQTVLVDNVMINTTTYTFEGPAVTDKAQCTNGGWQTFTSAPGPFKNQGDCVSFVATDGKNKASD